MNSTRTGHLLLSYYGDDFTGSTDVLEAMASHGFSSVLYLGIPDDALRSRFADCQVIGLAGTSRSESPEWMAQSLPEPLRWLHSLQADFLHYKTCSTFDSSARIGNIGKAIEIGKSITGQTVVPLIVGAPQLKRYTAFGHLFAAYRNSIYRIDRHPVMSCHPVTPMHESDLCQHLATQTDLEISLVDLAMLEAQDQALIDHRINALDGIALFDVDGMQTQALAGEQLFVRQARSPFVVGSSGVEYALLAHLRQKGQLPSPPGIPDRAIDTPVAVISGSVSPTTEKQIRNAAGQGFEILAVDPLDLINDDAESCIQTMFEKAAPALSTGRSVLIYTALGPDQDQGAVLDKKQGARHLIGRNLGRLLKRLVQTHSLARVIIAGGDTSSHALPVLDVHALTVLQSIPEAPGSPLCVCHGPERSTNGLQIALKGGQIGSDDYFATVRDLGGA